MSDIDDMFKRALSTMSGSDVDSTIEATKSGLTASSSDIDILDYIAVRLCECLDTKEMAFHGGYVLNKVLPKGMARGTVDVDVSILTEEYYSKVVEVLKSIGDTLVQDGVVASYKYKDVATEECSGGLDLYRLSSEKRKLGVDVGLRDVKRCVVPLTITSDVSAFRFSIERMLADKMNALHTDKRYRRTKDLYDFFVVTQCFDVDVEVLMSELTDYSKIDWSNSPMNPEIRDKYEMAYNKLRIYNGDDFKLVSSSGVQFKDAMSRVGDFISNIDKSVIWKCDSRSFIRK